MASRAFSAPVALPLALAARVGGVLRGLDFAPDLAEEIGTARWYRGLGVMLGGIGFALAMWPGIATIEMSQPQTIDARGGVVTMLYDAVSNNTAIVDPVGNRTTMVFDALNRLVERIEQKMAGAWPRAASPVTEVSSS